MAAVSLEQAAASLHPIRDSRRRRAFLSGCRRWARYLMLWSVLGIVSWTLVPPFPGSWYAMWSVLIGVGFAVCLGADAQ